MAIQNIQNNLYSSKQASQAYFYYYIPPQIQPQAQAIQAQIFPDDPKKRKSIKEYEEPIDLEIPRFTGKIGNIDIARIRTYWNVEDIKIKNNKVFPGDPVVSHSTTADGRKDNETWRTDASSVGLDVSDFADNSVILICGHSGNYLRALTKHAKDNNMLNPQNLEIHNESDYKTYLYAGNPKIKPRTEEEYDKIWKKNDLAIHIKTNRQAYLQAIRFLDKIIYSKLPKEEKELENLIDRQLEKGKLFEFKIVTNRLPGSRTEKIDGNYYMGIRNRTQANTASVIKAYALGFVDQKENPTEEEKDILWGVVSNKTKIEKRISRSIINGASGSPVAVGETNERNEQLKGVFCTGIAIEETLGFLRSKGFEKFTKKLIKMGFLKDDSEKSIKEFAENYRIVGITVLFPKNAKKLKKDIEDDLKKNF